MWPNGDAANLGWKLAAPVKGRGHLLDWYTAERHPVAARVREIPARKSR